MRPHVHTLTSSQQGPSKVRHCFSQSVPTGFWLRQCLGTASKKNIRYMNSWTCPIIFISCSHQPLMSRLSGLYNLSKGLFAPSGKRNRYEKRDLAARVCGSSPPRYPGLYSSSGIHSVQSCSSPHCPTPESYNFSSAFPGFTLDPTPQGPKPDIRGRVRHD